MDPDPRQNDSSSVRPSKSTLRFRLAALFVTCAGIGYIKKGGGTAASAVALIFWFGLIHLGVSQILISATLILTFIVGIWAIRIYEGVEGQEDSSEIVIDEWVGMGLSMLLVETSWSLAIAAFVLFRIFDIGKPPGVRYFDRNYIEGWGVMMDDVVAGIYVNVVLGVYLLWIQPHFFPL